jgi:Zn-finger nucleic acid-binding protein
MDRGELEKLLSYVRENDFDNDDYKKQEWEQKSYKHKKKLSIFDFFD